MTNDSKGERPDGGEFDMFAYSLIIASALLVAVIAYVYIHYNMRPTQKTKKIPKEEKEVTKVDEETGHDDDSGKLVYDENKEYDSDMLIPSSTPKENVLDKDKPKDINGSFDKEKEYEA
jgi:hypothetical protein|mmetsp:Transcript_16656/g.30295  ORF Transcript_16656/g.30295 Transcript_16656/m.30295 type:complete len:119 (-) Transcript_16656:172-528(-)|eukprot:CAMPEP_0198300350 /NCGR_PEP_ID=MMETSP1449-20131203/47829_1 /TAXON_ID=420275 /ORGANISM="Attheya septentrionalis, Strain CCMP2084" /LENGTH=118 /DNA_ID=CAMNT_0044002147 /DNA_START=63 /DNA_END=419 /DNA_ORIENTATION=-